MSKTSLIFEKLIRVLLPSFTGLTFAIGSITPVFSYSFRPVFPGGKIPAEHSRGKKHPRPLRTPVSSRFSPVFREKMPVKEISPSYLPILPGCAILFPVLGCFPKVMQYIIIQDRSGLVNRKLRIDGFFSSVFTASLLFSFNIGYRAYTVFVRNIITAAVVYLFKITLITHNITVIRKYTVSFSAVSSPYSL